MGTKQQTLFNFFTKSPVVKSPSSETFRKSETKEDSLQSLTPKSSKSSFASNSRTPKSSKLSQASKSRTPKSSKTSPNGNVPGKVEKKLPSLESSDGNLSETEETRVSPKNAKRRRIVIASESEDSDEYQPENNHESSDSCPSDSNDSLSETDSPKKKRKKTTKATTPSMQIFSNPKGSPNGFKLGTPITANSPKSSSPALKINTPLSKQKLSKVVSNGTSEENKGTKDDVKEFFHEKLNWLKEGEIRDDKGRLKSDSEYNPRTVFIPESFKKTLTPAMKQWWDLKSQHFDTVLFFKVGKFYELYHMDASIGVKELGLIFMKGDNAHSGFPEIAFGRYSECLVEKGYKVVRVEQTETPQMMEGRCKKMSRVTKFDKVVAREICQITSKGTKTLTYQDESMGINNNFLLAICEKHVDGAESASEYGICFVDTSIGRFTLGQFQDDRHGSRLLTLIALYPPVEILYDKGSITKKTLQLLNHNLTGVTKEALSSNSQFWDSTKVLKFMQKSEYFGKDDLLEYPETIKQMLDPDDRLLLTPLKQYELAFKSLGACTWYLKESCIEDCLLTMKLFEEYIPVDKVQSLSSKSSKDFRKHMVLDGITLQNLSIVPLLPSDNSDGTLLGTMDYCSTSFGKRLFRNWLCSPLCNPDSISDRLDAIDNLVEMPEVVEATVALLKKMPDLERLLSKIHAYGLTRSQEHPDSRAIFYDAEIYNKRKINDFLSTLEGFKQASEIVSEFKPHINSFKSSLLKQCTSLNKSNGFPNMLSALNYFGDAFDHEQAKKQGYIIPSPGVDTEYDSAAAKVKTTLKEFDRILEEQKSSLNCKVSYVSSGKNRYMLEVPENKKVPREFEFQGGRKGFKRYYTEETKELLTCLTAAEESRNSALQDVTRRIFAHFDKDYEMWKRAIHCISTVDVLISLVLYFKSSGVPMCRPTFSLPIDGIEPHMEIIDGQHPTFLKYFTGDDYIPNSVYIGPKRDTEGESANNEGGRVVLVTGPNMGGKSTLMRQAGTLVIMAHVGSYVPAESMQLTPVDRIFTRVGASDRISKGESTFFVEASETSSILHHATSHSFVLVDELGRGTSTYDGTAIAYAVLDYLSNNIGCRTLFSTHYHSLVKDFHEHPNVGLGQMACMVEKNFDCPALEKVTCLYKFVNGASPKSYGFNVALIAGISNEIVRQGFLKVRQLEYSARVLNALRNLLSVKKSKEIIEELQKKGVFKTNM